MEEAKASLAHNNQDYKEAPEGGERGRFSDRNAMSLLGVTPEPGFMVPSKALTATNTVPSSVTAYKVQQGPRAWWPWVSTTQATRE